MTSVPLTGRTPTVALAVGVRDRIESMLAVGE